MGSGDLPSQPHVPLDAPQFFGAGTVRGARGGFEHEAAELRVESGDLACKPWCRLARLLVARRQDLEDLFLAEGKLSILGLLIKGDDDVLDLVAPKKDISAAVLDLLPERQELFDAVLANMVSKRLGIWPVQSRTFSTTRVCCQLHWPITPIAS